MQTFGQCVREQRWVKGLGQQVLAAEVGVSSTCLSRIETETLDFGPYASDQLIVRMAKALDAAPRRVAALVAEVRYSSRHPDRPA